MRKEKHTPGSPNDDFGQSEKHTPVMKVVETKNDQSQVVFEIERHVRSIRALIQKLRPLDRQRYYDGLLSHLLAQPINYPITKKDNRQNASTDYSNLTVNELSLIRELSTKIEELYRQSSHELNN